MVLDHLTNVIAFLSWKKISSLVRCLAGSNVAKEWGTKFESLRNEKKAVRYRALKI